jgi:hypothetical protein
MLYSVLIAQAMVSLSTAWAFPSATTQQAIEILCQGALTIAAAKRLPEADLLKLYERFLTGPGLQLGEDDLEQLATMPFRLETKSGEHSIPRLRFWVTISLSGKSNPTTPQDLPHHPLRLRFLILKPSLGISAQPSCC